MRFAIAKAKEGIKMGENLLSVCVIKNNKIVSGFLEKEIFQLIKLWEKINLK